MKKGIHILLGVLVLFCLFINTFADSETIKAEPNYIQANSTTSKEQVLKNWFEVINKGFEPAVVENVLHPDWVDVNLSSQTIINSIRVDYAIDLAKAGKGVFDKNITIITNQGNAIYSIHLNVDQPQKLIDSWEIPPVEMTERGPLRKKAIFEIDDGEQWVVFDWDTLPSFILFNPFQGIASMIRDFILSLQPQNLKPESTYKDQTLYGIDTNSLNSNKPWWSFLFGG